jgi:hypothetical protein
MYALDDVGSVYYFLIAGGYAKKVDRISWFSSHLFIAAGYLLPHFSLKAICITGAVRNH